MNLEGFLPVGFGVPLYLRPTNCTEVDNIIRSMKSSSAGGNFEDPILFNCTTINNFEDFVGLAL